MKLLFTGITLCFLYFAQGQYSFKAIIKSNEQVLPGATILWRDRNKFFTADSVGAVTINDIAGSKQTFLISHVGFKKITMSYTFPLPSNAIIEIILEEEESGADEVIVTVTRTSRTIANTPTRIEVISGEELDEKGNMKPGDIRMMLNESTGIQTQQTSATSYNSSIRIQGLDGRYTQILKDGFPLYAGFSGGLSLMQIVPLDLKQVEVIKGSSSTLYGGGAIAGLVNLVSKTPTNKPELNFLANATSSKGLDLSGFYSQKFNKIGLTVFGSRNTGRPYDPGNIGLTAIPKFERYTFNPRLFIYGKNTDASIGFNYVTEERIGGSMDYIKNNTPGYFEKDNTGRFTMQAIFSRRLNEYSSLIYKNSYNNFKRRVAIPSYIFSGVQQSSFSELTYSYQNKKSQWIAGANFLTDDFKEDKRSALIHDYHYNTVGLFLQNTWVVSKIFTLETGLRGDYVNQYGLELLPRISALLKFTSKLTGRIGAGMGYKPPTIFNEEAERIQFRNILPIDEKRTKNERSIGSNVDVNYRTKIGDAAFSFNQLFFYTRLNKPLVLLTTANNNLEFLNANGYIDTRGIETNVKLSYKDFKLFIGYTYVDVNTHFNNVKARLPLTARHRLNNVLVYEVEGKLKLGLEAYYFSPQQLTDNSDVKSYWICGFMCEKFWKRFSLFVNFENFTDTRQTKFDVMYTGSIDNPVFKDIYAPLDGFIVNGGVKFRFWAK